MTGRRDRLGLSLAMSLVVSLCLGLSACGGSRFAFSDNREPDDSVPIAEGDGVFHQVKKGETAARIARAYEVPLDDLLGVNGVLDPRRLRAGDYLFVPGAKAVMALPVATDSAMDSGTDAPLGAQAGASLGGAPPGAPAWAPRDAPTVASRKDSDGTKLLWPVDGILTSPFGVRGSRRHDGIDIAAPEGTKVAAADRGTVLYVGDGYRGYGNLIIVKHGAGVVTVYAHNRDNLVREGQPVERGQHIANVGKTGRAEAPHLHFEVRQLDRPKNPLLFLP